LDWYANIKVTNFLLSISLFYLAWRFLHAFLDLIITIRLDMDLVITLFFQNFCANINNED